VPERHRRRRCTDFHKVITGDAKHAGRNSRGAGSGSAPMCTVGVAGRIRIERLVRQRLRGVLQDKPEKLAYTAAEPRTPRVRIFGDTAIFTGEMVNRVEKQGAEPTMSRLFVTQVASRILGEWKFVSFQSTRAAV
jgi:hypothetical protein